MPLPHPSPRKTSHTRALTLQGYERDDGLWDIEGHIVDSKPPAFKVGGCARAPNEPIHEMWVRLTIDTDFTIHDVAASSDAMPYAGLCDSTLPDYRKLIGLNLARGFRRAALEAMGGTKGCTHVTEMLTHLPSAAYQTMSTLPKMYDPTKNLNLAAGRCVALKPDGEMVRLYFPQSYTGSNKTGAK